MDNSGSALIYEKSKKFRKCDETNGLYSDERLGRKMCFGDGNEDPFGQKYSGTTNRVRSLKSQKLQKCQRWRPQSLQDMCKYLVQFSKARIERELGIKFDLSKFSCFNESENVWDKKYEIRSFQGCLKSLGKN